MAGYTPLFASLTTGTLCGKWPDIGLWPIVLSLADRHGIVDVTPDYLCRVTGLQIEAVTACMQRFCEPDPYSRSQEANGARLRLVDPARPWGWQVVNHRAYREKARKESFDAARVADGRNAERLKTRAHPRSSAQNRADPPSDSDSDSDKKREEKTPPAIAGSPARAARSALATRLPKDFELTPERRAIAEAEKADPDREFLNFTDHWKAASGAKARKNDWDATWRIWCRRAPDFKRNGRPAPPDEPKLTWRPPPDEDEPNARR